ncbi:hypothetical protein KFL_011270010, partial [Klebsormidium nitens]
MVSYPNLEDGGEHITKAIFDKASPFPVDLDAIYKWIGYSRKDSAVRKLRESFVENKDYCHAKIGSGPNPDKYSLSRSRFEMLAIQAKGEVGRRYQQYFQALETEYTRLYTCVTSKRKAECQGGSSKRQRLDETTPLEDLSKYRQEGEDAVLQLTEQLKRRDAELCFIDKLTDAKRQAAIKQDIANGVQEEAHAAEAALWCAREALEAAEETLRAAAEKAQCAREDLQAAEETLRVAVEKARVAHCEAEGKQRAVSEICRQGPHGLGGPAVVPGPGAPDQGPSADSALKSQESRIPGTPAPGPAPTPDLNPVPAPASPPGPAPTTALADIPAPAPASGPAPAGPSSGPAHAPGPSTVTTFPGASAPDAGKRNRTQDCPCSPQTIEQGAIVIPVREAEHAVQVSPEHPAQPAPDDELAEAAAQPVQRPPEDELAEAAAQPVQRPPEDELAEAAAQPVQRPPEDELAEAAAQPVQRAPEDEVAQAPSAPPVQPAREAGLGQAPLAQLYQAREDKVAQVPPAQPVEPALETPPAQLGLTGQPALCPAAVADQWMASWEQELTAFRLKHRRDPGAWLSSFDLLLPFLRLLQDRIPSFYSLGNLEPEHDSLANKLCKGKRKWGGERYMGGWFHLKNHYAFLLIDLDTKRAEYFDSYGVGLDPDMRAWVESETGCEVISARTRHQFGERECLVYCCYFVKERLLRETFGLPYGASFEDFEADRFVAAESSFRSCLQEREKTGEGVEAEDIYNLANTLSHKAFALTAEARRQTLEEAQSLLEPVMPGNDLRDYWDLAAELCRRLGVGEERDACDVICNGYPGVLFANKYNKSRIRCACYDCGGTQPSMSLKDFARHAQYDGGAVQRLLPGGLDGVSQPPYQADRDKADKLYGMEEYTAALGHYQNILTKVESDIEKVLTLGDIGVCLYYLNRDKEAEPIQRRALAIAETALGMEHEETGLAAANLARTVCVITKKEKEEALRLSRYEEALHLFQRALDVKEMTLMTREGKLALADALEEVGECLNLLGSGEQAEPYLRRCLVIRTEEIGGSSAHAASRICPVLPVISDTARLEALESNIWKRLAARKQAVNVFQTTEATSSRSHIDCVTREAVKAPPTTKATNFSSST